MKSIVLFVAVFAFVLNCADVSAQKSALSYFDTTRPGLWRDYPIDQNTKSSLTGNDTTIRIFGLGERFTSPFAATHLDSIAIMIGLAHYIDVPGNDIYVQVVGSKLFPNGDLFADRRNKYYSTSLHPAPDDTAKGGVVKISVPHVLMDTAFFVTVNTADVNRNAMTLLIGVDSVNSTELRPRDDNRDRGRELGEEYQSYMAGVQYSGTPGIYWYSNPLYIAYVSDENANVAIVSSNGIEVYAPAPNPARANTSLRYMLPAPSQVSLDISDVSGKLISHRTEGLQSAGEHTLQIGTEQLVSGVYNFTLAAGRTVFNGRFAVER
jgi:hypothetical protein